MLVAIGHLAAFGQLCQFGQDDVIKSWLEQLFSASVGALKRFLNPFAASFCLSKVVGSMQVVSIEMSCSNIAFASSFGALCIAFAFVIMNSLLVNRVGFAFVLKATSSPPPLHTLGVLV